MKFGTSEDAEANEVLYVLLCGSCLLCILDIASNDGNNSTEFQISEYVSIILSFWHEFYPRGIHIYGVREDRQ